MYFGTIRYTRHLSILVLLVGMSWIAGSGQQVVQRGALGKPIQVLDETMQWTTPLLVASDKDVEIYISDVSSADWLRLNYRDFYDRGSYTLSIFTFYRTTAACRQNQIGWGLGDRAHLDACVDFGYRVRTTKIIPQEKSVTLLKAAMILQNGEIDPTTQENREVFRFWNQLDPNTQSAIQKADALVKVQMKTYDDKMQSLR